jgi:hypothetical protein
MPPEVENKMRILDKVRKLFALGDKKSNAPAPERATANRKAEELLQRNGFSRNDLSGFVPPPSRAKTAPIDPLNDYHDVIDRYIIIGFLFPEGWKWAPFIKMLDPKAGYFAGGFFLGRNICLIRTSLNQKILYQRIQDLKPQGMQYLLIQAGSWKGWGPTDIWDWWNPKVK